MGFAWPLAYLETGWTEPLRKEYLNWYTTKAVKYRGGNKYSQIVNTLRQTALSHLTTEEKQTLKAGLEPNTPARLFTFVPNPEAKLLVLSLAQDKKTPELPMADKDGFINLFNGKDLTNWEGYPGYWSVKDDAITGSETSANSKHTFLVLSASKEEPVKFSNFEMHFSYRWTDKGKGGNSGLQFRSKIIDAAGYKVGGYQADLDVNGQYDGGYYDEAGVAGKRGIFAPRGFKTTWDADNKKKQEPLPSGKTGAQLKQLIKPVGEWNTYVLVADHNHMTSKVNGELMAELIDDSPKALKEGVLAFQIHQGATMTIQFKDVKIKLLR